MPGQPCCGQAGQDLPALWHGMLPGAGAAARAVVSLPDAWAEAMGTTTSALSMATMLKIEIQALKCFVCTPEMLPELASTQ
jgi:hypothetical protein